MSLKYGDFIEDIEIDEVSLRNFFRTVFISYFKSPSFFKMVKDTFIGVLISYSHDAIKDKNYDRDDVTYAYLKLKTMFGGKEFNEEGSFTEQSAKFMSSYINIKVRNYVTGSETTGYKFNINISNVHKVISNLSKGNYSWSESFTEKNINSLKYLLTNYAVLMNYTNRKNRTALKLYHLKTKIRGSNKLEKGIKRILEMVTFEATGKHEIGIAHFSLGQFTMGKRIERSYLYDSVMFLFNNDKGKELFMENIINYLNNYHYDIKAYQ